MCLEKSGKRSNFVLEKSGKPQSYFCMNPALKYRDIVPCKMGVNRRTDDRPAHIIPPPLVVGEGKIVKSWSECGNYVECMYVSDPNPAGFPLSGKIALFTPDRIGANYCVIISQTICLCILSIVMTHLKPTVCGGAAFSFHICRSRV